MAVFPGKGAVSPHPPKDGRDMWPLQSMWYSMVVTLMTWTLPEPWEAVDGFLIPIEKVLCSLEEQLLEKPWAAAG